MTDSKLALAHRMLTAARSETWLEAVLPFLIEERAIANDLMASQTDPLQLMRYAGAVQALTSLIKMEERAKAVVDASLNEKLKKIS